jgi:hypothetical protein
MTTESVVEDAALAWLGSLGYTIKHGPEIAAGEFLAERAATRAKNARVQFGNLGSDVFPSRKLDAELPVRLNRDGATN